MTYSAFETSVESGQPIDLYEFSFGASLFRFTSQQNEVELTGGIIYSPTTISRGRIVQAVRDQSAERLEIRMPANSTFVQEFTDISPGQRVIVTVLQLHRGDLGGAEETRVLFKGNLKNVSFTKDGREAVLQALPLTAAFSRPTPRFTYQGLCNHMLYDSRCKIDRNDPTFRYTGGTVTAVSGNVITVSGAAAFNALTDFFVAGYVEFDNDFRLVREQSGDDLTLMIPFKEDVLNQSVILRAGCKLRLDVDCDQKFDNVENYGGFPWIPQKNPFTTGLV